MSTLLKLRDYQEACIDALMRGWEDGHDRLAGVLPTGAGKTVVFSHLVSRFVAENPGRRVIILAHTDELVNQAAKKLRDVAPHLKVGIVKATRNEVAATVVVASVQSLRSAKRRDMIRSVGLVIVDECHHASAKTYRDILEHYGCMGWACRDCIQDDEDPSLWCDCRDDESCDSGCRQRAHDAMDCPNASPTTRTAGFTATMVRGDNKSLGDIWQKVVYRRDISFMIRRGYLLEPIGKRIEIDAFDLSKVKKTAGDYQAGALEDALDASLAPEIVAKAYVEHAEARSGILFAPTVESAYHFAEALIEQGITCEVVHGALGREERRAILARLESGETQVISNCMVLTEGFDSPRVSCIVIARPTRSSGLYQQMVGRGLRIDPTIPRAGQDCLILDVVGASQVHGLASLVDLSSKDIRLADGMGLIEAEDLLDAEEAGAGDGPVRTTFYGPTVVVDFDPLADASKRLWLKTEGGTYFLSAGVERGAYVFVLPSTPQPCGCDENCDPSMIICHDSRGNEVSCGDECACQNFPGCVEGKHGEAPCATCEASGWVPPAPGTYDVVWATKTLKYTIDNYHAKTTEHRGISLDLAFAWGEDVAVDMGGESGGVTLNKSAGWRKRPASDKAISKCRMLGIEPPPGATGGQVSELIDTRLASRRIDPIAAWVAEQRKG